ncbi:uncharacterized protein V6R79_013795 [Siganus canaliculatus]
MTENRQTGKALQSKLRIDRLVQSGSREGKLAQFYRSHLTVNITDNISNIQVSGDTATLPVPVFDSVVTSASSHMSASISKGTTTHIGAKQSMSQKTDLEPYLNRKTSSPRLLRYEMDAVSEQMLWSVHNDSQD